MLKNYIQKKNKILNFKNKQLLIVIIIIIVIISIMPKTDKKINTNSSEQQCLQSILSEIEGVGDVSVMVTYYSDDDKKEESKAKGAVIICDGADDAQIRNEVSDAVKAALNLPAHKVKVFKKSNK